MGFFLGVDGGQTTTRMVVGDELGIIRGWAAGGPSNHTEEPGGRERLEEVTRATLRQVLEGMSPAGPEPFEFVSACFGMTGETEIKQQVLQRIVLTRHLSVVHDSVNALAGATAGEPGVIVIAGAGSVLRGINADGQELLVGGWGHLFGDEGSAYAIGREAVRVALAEFDKIGPPSKLTPLLFERLGVRSAYELKDRYYSGAFSRDHLAGLSVWVDEMAEMGDPVCERVLKIAGNDLAQHASLLVARLFRQEGYSKASACPVVSYTGGVFRSRLVRETFERAILEQYPYLQVRPPLLPPVFGSLLLAYRSAGVVIPREQMSRWAQV
jgi:N-acetylglucosamine kinase-like BadF-type ATPase